MNCSIEKLKCPVRGGEFDRTNCAVSESRYDSWRLMFNWMYAQGPKACDKNTQANTKRSISKIYRRKK